MMKLKKFAAVLAISILALGISPGATGSAEPGWQQTGLTEAVIALAMHPGSENTLYTTGASGLWRTTDAGSTWSLISTEKVGGSLTIDPKTPTVMYAAGNQQRGGSGILKSVNGGLNWSVVRPGETPSQIVIDPVNTGIVYAGAMVNNNYEIFKSTNGGSSWITLLHPNFSYSPGMGYVTALALSPSHLNTIYAGLAGYHIGFVTRSDDGGATWRTVDNGSRSTLMTPGLVVIDPQSPDTVYVGWELMGYKKFFKTLDGGTTWLDLSPGLPSGGSSISDLIIDPADGSALIAVLSGAAGGTPDGTPGGVFASSDGGASWSELAGAGMDKFTLVLAPTSRRLFAGGSSGVSVYQFGFQPAQVFRSYYDSHDGMRILGSALGPLATSNGYRSQYFEKGRIEDHSAEVTDNNWKFMYGLVADELQASRSTLPVGGEVSNVTYAGINNSARPDQRISPPPGFQGGVATNSNGSIFVPFSAQLLAVPGHNIPKLFWDYINRDDLFPGGWLHDIGLPVTEPMSAMVDKGEMKGRSIVIQAFQRTILTYDPANPADWQVERANVGTDALKK